MEVRFPPPKSWATVWRGKESKMKLEKWDEIYNLRWKIQYDMWVELGPNLSSPKNMLFVSVLSLQRFALFFLMLTFQICTRFSQVTSDPQLVDNFLLMHINPSMISFCVITEINASNWTPSCYFVVWMMYFKVSYFISFSPLSVLICIKVPINTITLLLMQIWCNFLCC